MTAQEGEDPAEEVASYEYDAAGRRTKKTAGADVTNYYYNDIDLLYTIDGTGSTIEEYVLESDGSIMSSKRPDENTYWYRQDVRGSVTNIVDGTDDVVKSYTYEAYGKTSGTGTFVNSFAYTGAVNDEETGLVYMNARYYEPETGRFISEDSYRGDGEAFWNLYLYCNGDPVNYFDPTGHKWTMIGSRSTKKGKLKVAMCVYKKVVSGYTYYAAYGYADWANGVFYRDGYNLPDAGDDYEALTWGGGGKYLVATGKNCYGKYQYNKGNILCSLEESDSYRGYCWSFQETKYNSWCADYINCWVKLKAKRKSPKKETNVKFTYIHTWQETTGNISFSSASVASVSLSSTSKKWRVQLDVPGIKY